MRELLFSIFTFLFGCESVVDSVYSIRIENNSQDTVYVYASYDFPDTSITPDKPRLIMVYPEKFSHLDSKDDWASVVQSDTICIFVLDKHQTDGVAWEDVITRNLILKRYDLALYEMDEMNWTIQYP